MICKGTDGEHENLRRALASIAPYVDGLFVTLTGETNKLAESEKVCREFGANISYTRALYTVTQETVDFLTKFFGYAPYMKVGDKIFLFDEARNFNFSQIPKEYDYILWMDADDVFRGGEKLRTLAENGLKAGIEVFYFNYVYQAEYDENLNVKHVLIEHMRERLVRNTGVFKWIACIHETLIEQKPTRKTDNYDCDILHLATDKDRDRSLERNMKNLELSIYQTKAEDPRPIYYLSKAYYDLSTPENDEKVIPLIEQYLWGEHKSGWAEERAQACEYLAEVYRRQGKFNNAIKAIANAMIEQPQNPSIFVSMALNYSMAQDWERAMFWLRLAAQINERKTTLVKNPKDVQVRTLQIMYNCLINMGKIKEAWAAIVKLAELLPNEKDVIETLNFTTQLRAELETAQTFLTLAKTLKNSGEIHKLRPLLQAVPALVERNPDIENLAIQNLPARFHDDDEITIYCGPGFTPWSPKAMKNPRGTFVGGSEEAVICLSEALAKEGWKVTVYADPGPDEGEINGVTWLPFYKYSKRDHFNIFIVWRMLGFLDNEGLQAKKVYVWNHDIQNNLEYTTERVGKFTKAIFLSKWHRDNVPSLPEDKVFLSSNGI